MCMQVLTESNKSRFDSYSRQEQCMDHIPYYLSRLLYAHFFPTTFHEIAVFVPCSFLVFFVDHSEVGIIELGLFYGLWLKPAVLCVVKQ